MIDLNNITSLGKNCCGCGACEQVCPKHCINFKENIEGFVYPEVNAALCVECGVCITHCPILSDVQTSKNPEVYAAKYVDRASTFNSTSGGIFIAVARYILKQRGIVFGCAYDSNFTAQHIAVEKESELYKLQGSKYVQSNTLGVYKKVEAELKKNRYVLFSGTGCQVAGLLSYLGKAYDKLFTIDIVCHGVPSPLLFKKYLDYMGKRLGGKIIEYNFRSKEKRGWDLYYKASTETRSKSDYGFFDPYYNAFLNCKTYRESCYNCKFANSERVGDITLADYWAIKKFHPSFYDQNGVSLVLLNSDKGKKLWNHLNDDIDYISSTIDNATAMNKNLCHPSKRPNERDGIYDGIYEDFENYLNTKLAFKVNPKTKLKKMIPLRLKNILKK